MTTRRTKRTRCDLIYAALRSEILGGRRPPGQRLKFPELSTTYDASVSVIREALTRLAAEGLVTSEPHQGYAITELSVDRLDELTDARLELETLVLARSLRDGDLSWESGLVAAHHTLASVPFLSATDPPYVTDEWAEAHAGFHRALLSGCANRRLVDMANGLRDEAELYRRWSQPLGGEKDRDLAAEHRELLDTSLARDTKAATESLRAHITHTTRLLREAADHFRPDNHHDDDVRDLI